MWQYSYTEIGKIGPFSIIGDKYRLNRSVGLVDKNRKLIISPNMGYEDFTDYHDGLLIAFKPTETGSSWMVIDYMGNPISDGYTFIRYADEGFYDVEKGSRHNIMRPDGSFVLKEWPHRVSKVYNGYFTFGKTIRKTKTTPTRYIDGLAHVNGIVVFPMIFDSMVHSDGAFFSAKLNKELFYVHDGAVYDPTKKHYPLLSQSGNFGVLIEKILNWIIPGLKFFYRDTDAEINVETLYPIGKVLRSGFFVDLSTRLLKPSKNTRFIIAASHAAVICDYKSDEEKKRALGFSPKAEEWQHAVLHKNTWLKVMDVYKKGNLTQILLLQIPETAAKFFGDEDVLLNFINDELGDENSIVDLARRDFDEKLIDMVHPRSLDLDLAKRMSQPIGMDPNGNQYSVAPDLSLYESYETSSDGTPGVYYSRFIHRLAQDSDIISDVDGFPWRGVVGTVCEGCMYANGTGDKPFGCGRLFEKTFRANYIKGFCDYFKLNLWTDSLFEYRRRCESIRASKRDGIYAERLFRDFIHEKLDGNIENLTTFNLSSLKGDSKYGGLKGPDMVVNFAIVKSIMEIAFGEYWPELNVDSLDVCTYQVGDIINDNRLVGIRLAPRNFKALNRFPHNYELVDMAEELYSIKSTIGNFVVWPNKAFMCNLHENSKMRGYIDRLFLAMYDIVTEAPNINMDVAEAMYKNRNLMKDYQGIEGFRKFMKVSLLDDFLDKDGVPHQLFDGISNSAKDYNPDLLPAAVKQYHDFIVPMIHRRTNRIIEILKSKI